MTIPPRKGTDWFGRPKKRIQPRLGGGLRGSKKPEEEPKQEEDKKDEEK
jgi:hypothetical protein